MSKSKKITTQRITLIPTWMKPIKEWQKNLQTVINGMRKGTKHKGSFFEIGKKRTDIVDAGHKVKENKQALIGELENSPDLDTSELIKAVEITNIPETIFSGCSCTYEALVNLNLKKENVENNCLTLTGEKLDKNNTAAHGPDFRSVYWHGVCYDFTPYQAACVKVLWEAWENNTPDVGTDAILREANTESRRLVDVFKGSPAWKKLIVPGKTKGTYRLNAPTST